MNNNEIDIKLIAKDLASATIKEVKKEITGLGDAASNSSKGASVLTGVVAGLTTAVTTFGLSIISSGIDSLTGWFKDAVSAGADFETTLVALRIQSSKFGEDFMDTTKTAEMLGKELRIGVGPAAQGLLNLFKSGLNLEQATELMRRFANEAYTVTGNTLSLSQKIENLTYAYQTNNSAIGNASGISENWTNIVEKGTEVLKAQGVAVADITEEQAKYAGTLAITESSLGLSAEMTETYAGKQAMLNYQFEELQRKVGVLLLPVAQDLLTVFSEMFTEISPQLEQWATVIIPEIGRLFKQEIVPEIKKFIDYLGSDQFKADMMFWRDNFKGVQEMVRDIVAWIKEAIDKFNILSANGREWQRITDESTTLERMLGINNLKFLAGPPQYAEGTDYHPGGMAIVGERGPELVNLPRGSQVMSNIDSMGRNIVNNFYGYDTEQISDRINQQIKLGY